MKKIFFILLFFNGLLLKAQSYAPQDKGSTVKFYIKNWGLTTVGVFNGLKGIILFDPFNISAATINVTVDAKTINTEVSSRDNHLKKEDYFYIEKYPVLSFASTKIISGNKQESLQAQGKLTIKGVTKEIAFPFVAKEQKEGFLFEGMFTINRRDFNVGKGSLILSDNLNVSFSVFAKKI